jgi:glycosyl transferase, family 25
MTADPDFQFECHVINLKRTPERLASFLAQNAGTGLAFHRFEAADGNDISEADAIRLNLIKRGTKWPTRGTIGVALSHRNLWEKAIADDCPLIVLEDDLFIREDFREVFPPAIARLGAWDIILFSYNADGLVQFSLGADLDISGLFVEKAPTVAHLKKFVGSREPVHVFRLRHAFGLCGYVISPAGARKLLARCYPMDNRMVDFPGTGNRFAVFSIDTMMNAFFRHLEAYVFIGPLALPVNDWANSTVEKRKR